MNENSSFNTGEPSAYFLTWTTYGTWLPGDDRGWRRKRAPDLQPPNPLLAGTARTRMAETTFVLSEAHRRLVEGTIREHCRLRNWALHAISVRTNHVHVALTATGYRPEAACEQFKSWCTRRLKGEAPARTRFWTEGACCRWINTEDDLEAAVLYVAEAQDRKGLDQ